MYRLNFQYAARWQDKFYAIKCSRRGGRNLTKILATPTGVVHKTATVELDAHVRSLNQEQFQTVPLPSAVQGLLKTEN
jgi:hypothetical protein